TLRQAATPLLLPFTSLFRSLVNDYSRKGFVDGRALRLPTIVVRPGRPNRAASTFASSIIREPLAGIDAICPVGREAVMYVLSPRSEEHTSELQSRENVVCRL